MTFIIADNSSSHVGGGGYGPLWLIASWFGGIASVVFYSAYLEL
jgi:hypothetical protein